MSTSVGTAQLDLGINYKGFQKELGGLANKSESMIAGAFKGIGRMVAVAFATNALWNFGKDSVKLASDLEEVQNVVDVTFGSMSGEIDRFAKGALDNFGVSELSAKKFAGAIGSMFKSSNITGSEMVKMSEGVVGLAGDMASFYNMDFQTAFDKIRSGLAGEIEPLRQVGINMSVANMEAYALSKGITKSWQSMGQAEQTLLRYNYLMKYTADAQGDFARTSNSWANQTRLLGEQFKILQGTLGAGFISALTPVVRGLNYLISKLQIAAQYFTAFMQLLFGVQKPAVKVEESAVNAGDAMADSLGGAGKAAKKAGKDVKGSLAPFDQLNVLSKEIASNSGGAGAGGAGAAGAGVDFGAVSTPEIKIDTTQFQPFLDFLADAKAMAIEVGKYVSDIFGPTFKTAVSVGKTIVEGFASSFSNVFYGMEEAAKPVIEWFVSDGFPLIASFVNSSLEVLNGLFVSVKGIFDTIWSQAVQPGLMLFSSMIVDTLGIIKSFWDTWGLDIVAGIKMAITNISSTFQNWWTSVFKPIWDEIISTVKWLWENHLKELLKSISTFVGELATSALEIYNEFIVPLVNWFIKEFGPKIVGAFKTVIGIVGTLLGTVAGVASGVLKSLGGIIKFITGVFTGDWKKAWTGVKQVVVGIFDSIKSIIKGVVNIVIDAINIMIRALNGINIKVPNWVPGMGGKEIGFKIPSIPKLANGGLAYGPTLAMVGDNKGAKSDPEVISPLSKLQEILGGGNNEMLNVLNAILQAINAQEFKAEFKIGEEEFGRASARAINAAQRQAGKTLVIV